MQRIFPASVSTISIKKLSTRGREQHDLRPKVALLRGRGSCYFRPRADNKVGVQNQFIRSMQGSHKLILEHLLAYLLSKILVQ